MAALLLFAGVVLPCFKTSAATTTATVSATIISLTKVPIVTVVELPKNVSTEVPIVTVAELLENASTGVLTLTIPGAGASGTGAGAVGEGMTLTSTGVVGNTIVFSTADTASLATLASAVAASGGSLGTNGLLSTGQGVCLIVTQVEQGGNGKGTVYAIVAYN